MFLILDFTQSLKLAIVNKKNLIIKELKTKKNISEILIPEIDKFLNKSKINIQKIKSIYIITGPGSFTGVRSSLTYAKSLKLIMKINIFGISKFEIINHKIGRNKFIKKKIILLHFKDNQFFLQQFKGSKAVNDPKLINFDNEELNFNDQTIYFYDNILLESYFKGRKLKKMKENFRLVDYNLSDLNEIIIANVNDNADPKPLYISNYY